MAGALNVRKVFQSNSFITVPIILLPSLFAHIRRVYIIHGRGKGPKMQMTHNNILIRAVAKTLIPTRFVYRIRAVATAVVFRARQ